MKDEYEVIEHPYIDNVNIFLVYLDHRTPHLHEDIELILVLEGHITTRTEHEEYALHPNSLFLFNSNQLHEFYASGEGALILCLQMSPNFCTHYYPAISFLHFDSNDVGLHTSQDYQDYVKGILRETAYQYFAKHPGFEFLCLSLLNQLFWILINKIPYHILSKKEKEANMEKTERLRRILNYIDENYRGKILLSDIAEMESLSMSHLSHFIKDNLNQTFQEYVSHLRCNYARKLIVEEDMKLIDVCMESGFSDYRYLYKAFLKNYGCSPKEYPNNYHKSITPIRKYHSPQTSETFYTVENTLSILEKLHGQNVALINDFPNPW